MNIEVLARFVNSAPRPHLSMNITEPLEFKDGHLTVPNSPGIGPGIVPERLKDLVL